MAHAFGTQSGHVAAVKMNRAFNDFLAAQGRGPSSMSNMDEDDDYTDESSSHQKNVTDLDEYGIPGMSGAFKAITTSASGRIELPGIGSVSTAAQIQGGPPYGDWIQQDVSTGSAKIGDKHEAKRRLESAKYGGNLLAPHSTNPKDFNMHKHMVGIVLKPEANSKEGYANTLAGEDGVSPIRVYVVMNGLTDRILGRIMEYVVVISDPDPEKIDASGEDMLAIAKSGLMDLYNTCMKNIETGDFILGNAVPARVYNEQTQMILPGVTIFGDSGSAFYVQTYPLKTNCYSTLLDSAQRRCMRYFESLEVKRQTQEANSTDKLAALFLKSVDAVCQEVGVPNVCPLIGNMQLWFAWNWLQMLMQDKHIECVATPTPSKEFNAQIMHAFRAMTVYLMIAGAIERTFSWCLAKYEDSLPESMSISASETSTSPVYDQELLDLVDVDVNLELLRDQTKPDRFITVTKNLMCGFSRINEIHNRFTVKFLESGIFWMFSSLIGTAMTPATAGNKYKCQLK